MSKTDATDDTLCHTHDENQKNIDTRRRQLLEMAETEYEQLFKNVSSLWVFRINE